MKEEVNKTDNDKNKIISKYVTRNCCDVIVRMVN